jgi:addiction module HigA family antidote
MDHIRRTGDAMTYPADHLPPIHPGVFLREELETLNLSASTFAEHIGVPHNAVTGIINGDRSITVQMALRFGQTFETTPQYWLNLQNLNDVKRVKADMGALSLKKGCAV